MTKAQKAVMDGLLDLRYWSDREHRNALAQRHISMATDHKVAAYWDGVQHTHAQILARIAVVMREYAKAGTQ